MLETVVATGEMVFDANPARAAHAPDKSRDDEAALLDELTRRARAERAAHQGRDRGSALTPEMMRELETLGYAPESVKLAHLVPLVQVAWAEGRVTRRERALIQEAARLRGIEAGSAEFGRLAGWLDFKPTEEFFERNLRLLRAMLRALPLEEREESRHDLIALCARVAEVSGGEADFAGGGRRICDEEVEIVKRIAAELNRAGREEMLARINLADATGITDARTLDELAAHGFTGAGARLLPLVPLVEVAWAEGGVTRRERQFILLAARLRGIASGDEADMRLKSWLKTRPSKEFFRAALAAVRQMFHLFPPELREVNEWDLLANCEHVAVASGETAGEARQGNIGMEEQRLLDEIAERMASRAKTRAGGR